MAEDAVPADKMHIVSRAGLMEDRRLHWIAAVCGIALTLWLLLPAATPAHVEGFSAAVAALGLHINHGTIAYFDQLEPLNTEYFGLTKLGLAMSIAGLKAALPVSADLAFRLLMWGSLLLFLVSSSLLVRRWTAASWPAVLAPLVIIPGIFESSFIYSDNVPAAAFATASLCLLYAQRLPVIALSGVLFGCAVLTRTDTALLACAFPVILVERFGISRAAAMALGVAAAAGAAVLIGTLAWFNVTPLDIIRVGSAAVAAWDRPLSADISMAVLAFYLGLGGIGLVILGAGSVLRDKNLMPAIRLLLPPAIVLLVLRQSLWETRQLLVLTPFLAALATIGIVRIFAPAEDRGQRLLRTTILTLIALSLVGPVTGKGFADGPRAFSGRVWQIPTVLEWQAGARGDVAALDSLVSRLSGVPRVTMLANSWDEDRYLHLSLLDQGYALMPRQQLPAACWTAADHYQRGQNRIDIVRNYQSFVPYAQGLAADRFARRSLPCIRALQGAPLILVAEAEFVGKVPPAVFAPPIAGTAFNDPRHDDRTYALTYRQLRDIATDTAARAQLLASYRRDVLDYRERIGAERDRKWSGRTISEAEDATRARTAFAMPHR